MDLLRYPKNDLLTSTQDPFIDIIDWLGFLCAKDYTIELLQKSHNLSHREAKSRTQLIIPHIRMSIKYIRQSLEGPSEISFLPSYYAILNLMKVYILTGTKHASLSNNRWHGASYNVRGKDSQSILTEIVKLHKDGVFPLFYESITEQKLTNKNVKIKISDILPFLSNVTYEYGLATGQKSRLCQIGFSTTEIGKSIYPVATLLGNENRNIRKIDLKLLRNFKGQRDNKKQFIGNRINDQKNQTDETINQLNRHLIYRNNPNSATTAISSMRLHMFEELPIAILFFYMSSIVRYKPEFFDQLQDSKFWPLLSSSRTHSFIAFLLAFWSFMNQKNCFVNV